MYDVRVELVDWPAFVITAVAFTYRMFGLGPEAVQFSRNTA
jgi:hypothetical protein